MWVAEQGDEVLKVLVADDHTMILEMIEMLMRNSGAIDLTTATDVNLVLASIVKKGPFDLILLDYDMPGMNGLEGLEIVRKANDGRPVGIITGNPSPRLVETASAAGAAGLISKNTSMRSLSNAMRFMAAGERFFPMELVREQEQSRKAASVQLSDREMTVLQRLAEGMPNREIGQALELAEPTVKMHVKSICRKLGVNNRTQAVIAARNQKLV